jgi:hypothetical protein
VTTSHRLSNEVTSSTITPYQPYQLNATEEQFFRAYPRAREFFALKRRTDPTNKFRNELWNKYYRSPLSANEPQRLTPSRLPAFGLMGSLLRPALPLSQEQGENVRPASGP